MPETLKYDENYETPEQQTAFAYRAQQVLQDNHNIIGKWKREGITQAEYDTLPTSWKALFKYTDKLLSKEDWDKFKTDIFKPLQAAVMQGVLENRESLPQYTNKLSFEKDWGEFKESLKNSTTYNIDLDNIMGTE